MHLSGLFIYPVKSLRGVEVTIADIDTLGLVGDRRFLVVDANDRFLTQRTLPRMALVTTALQSGHLLLSHPDAGYFSVPLRAAEPVSLRRVAVWKSEGLLAEDCGRDVADWLSHVLATPCRLVRIGPAFERPVLKPTAHPGDRVAFADAYPFMAISDASLADLNERLVSQGAAPVPMNRFRPNLVFSGAVPYAEDTWPHVRVGDIVLRAGGSCARCIVTTTDQDTATVGHEPLRLLASYRRDPVDPTRINFGQNFLHETKTGTLRVGDPVTPLR